MRTNNEIYPHRYKLIIKPMNDWDKDMGAINVSHTTPTAVGNVIVCTADLYRTALYSI